MILMDADLTHGNTSDGWGGARVLVVGGSSGIGAGTVAYFTAAGAEVLVADVNPPSDDAIQYVRCDLREPASIEDLIKTAGPGWDVLAHVAGVPGTWPAVDVLNVNFLGMRHLVRGMLDQLNPGGSAVVVASTAGMLWQHRIAILDKLLAVDTVPDLQAWVDAEGASYPAYNLSKEAAVLVVKRLATHAWTNNGIRINAVSPGPVETAILPDFESTMGKEFLDSVSATVGRHARVEDIVPVIAFLSSPAAGWVIGQRHPRRCRLHFFARQCSPLIHPLSPPNTTTRPKAPMTVAYPPAAGRQYSDLDISDPEFWGQHFDVRDETFAQLRAADGLSWHRPLESIYGLVEPGFWALTRRADIVYASQHPELFTSAQGVALNPLPIEIQRISTFFLAMDPPEHTVYRRLISSAFTPKQLRRIEDQIHRNAVQIVDDLVGAGEIDFVKACSARLPMLTIAEMLGVAADKRERVAQAGEAIFSSSDEDYASRQDRAEFAMREMQLLVDTAIDLAKFRRRQPGEDLMTNIVNAEVDGTRITDEQIGAFMILLTSAGNDTTKQTTTHAMKALVDHPEQRAWLMEDFDARIGPAIEEFVRWTTPVIQFARFATQDTELAGQKIAAGDKVGLFYCSANRDESEFTDPTELRPRTIAEPTNRLRRTGAALLPRQPTGEGGAATSVPRTVDSSSPNRIRGARVPAEQLRARHQTPTGVRTVIGRGISLTGWNPVLARSSARHPGHIRHG